MRIAQIAPIIESVPPPKYGGTERVVSTITEELVKRGHEVTLFASGDSTTKAKLSSVYPTALRKARIPNMYGPNIWSLVHVGMAYQNQAEFDIIHDHNSQNNPVSLPLANLSTTPVVMTLHGVLTNEYAKAFEFYRKPYLVTISKRQQEPSPDLNYAGNVYNGLAMDHYPFSKKDEGYLLFVGRVTFERGAEVKGLHHAIDIAEITKLPLKIAAKVDPDDKESKAYFRKHIKPRLTDKIQFIGEVDETERNKLMSKALCLLHMVNFDEPFGLTLIESMACGAPVVAFDKGAIPEIVEHGKNGFIARSDYEAANFVKEIKKLDRTYCRKSVIKKYSAERMVDEYEQIYSDILQKQQKSI